MVNQDEPSETAGVGGELLSLVSGTHPKSRWVRGGMFASALGAGFVAPYLGWRQYRLRMILVISAAWFVIALVIAIRGSSKDP
jgi:hypothetical protein